MNVTISGRYDSSNKTFRQMPSVANIAREPKNYLGVGMAEKEWNANPKLASKKFLHTGAYHNFLNEDTLILLGRTGTGKTSILKCIEYSINNKLCTDYTDVILEDFSEIFDLLLRQDASELESTTMNQMKVIIDTTVITMVMIHMVKKYSEPQQLKTTKNYLTTNGLYNNKKAIGVISTILNSFRMSSNDKISNIYNTISDIYSFITKQLYLTYTAAKEELIEFLSVDCTATEGEWHSDSEIKIDKNGFVIINGNKTKEFWNGSIYFENKPLRLKIRNICGDETVWSV